MCAKNTFLKMYYYPNNVDSLTTRTGHGYFACSPSTISVKDDCQHIHGVPGANP